MKTQLDYSGAEATWAYLAQEDVILLADANTHGFCLPVLFKQMPFLQGFPRMVVPAGEAAKDLDVARYIWRQLQDLGAKNNTVLLVVGGGALCDVGAFCASVYKRGMRLRLVPTTLLAMVDAALGGKTALDFEGIKNSIGSFYAAEALYVQPDFLNTLPERQRLSGIAEMIKHALLEGGSTWENVLQYSPEQFSTLEAIRTSQAIKMRFVEADPYDKGIRQCLNLGHSIGHALEAERFKREYPLLHGEAILWGMYLELYLSIGHCGLLPQVWQDYTQLFRRLFPALQHIAPIHAEAIMPYLMHDKKNTKGIRMSLISSPGSPIGPVSVSTSSIIDAIYENCYQ